MTHLVILGTVPLPMPIDQTTPDDSHGWQWLATGR
jgi:hypothetical protein